MKSLQLAKPHLLMMVGIPGSGKSCFAEKFADTFGAPHVAYEKIRPFATDEAGLQHLVADQINELFKTKQTIVVDGGTETRTQRSDLTRLARTAGYETLVIWVQTDPATAKARAIKPAKHSTKLAMNPDEFAQALRRFTAPNLSEKPVVISGKHTNASQTKVVLKKLSEPRTTISTHSTPPVRATDSSRRNITIR